MLFSRVKAMIKPLIIITDWDETITLEDTIQFVAGAAYKFKDYSPQFTHFTNVYLREYEKYQKVFQDKLGQRDSIEKEIEFQRCIRPVEETSINEMIKRKLFDQITPHQFASQGRYVKLRPAIPEFFEKCNKLGIPVVILSVNWTSLIMKEALKLNGVNVDKIEFLVNEFEFENGKCTGRWKLDPTIRTGIDKEAVINQYKETYDNVMYIGDSSTDILPLLKADLGFIIKGSSVIKNFQKLGVSVNTDNNSGHIYIGDWNDIINKL